MIGVTRQTLTEWAKEPGFPKRKQQGYDVKEVVRWVRENKPLASPVAASKSEADLRLQNARADRAELEAALYAGEVIAASEVRNMFLSVAGVYAQMLDSVGARIADELARETDPAVIRHRIFVETRQIRTQTARKLEDYAGSI